MVTYKKIEDKGTKKYLKTKPNGAGVVFVKADSVPHEVMEKFEYTNEVEYDDQPERRRCLFCDAPQKRIRALNGSMVDLCEWHYMNTSLGKIAQKVREFDQEQQAKQAQKEAKKKPKTKKTALSNMVK